MKLPIKQIREEKKTDWCGHVDVTPWYKHGESHRVIQSFFVNTASLRVDDDKGETAIRDCLNIPQLFLTFFLIFSDLFLNFRSTFFYFFYNFCLISSKVFLNFSSTFSSFFVLFLYSFFNFLSLFLNFFLTFSQLSLNCFFYLFFTFYEPFLNFSQPFLKVLLTFSQLCSTCLPLSLISCNLFLTWFVHFCKFSVGGYLFLLLLCTCNIGDH